MDRLSFFRNINGISYPEMLVDFFDHFIALKQIIDSNNCTVNIISYNKGQDIEFDAQFKDPSYLDKTLKALETMGNVIVIYTRTMTVHAEVLTDRDLKIKLY